MTLRDAVCEALWAHIRAQDLVEVCVYLGLAPHAEYEDPFISKRSDVRTRLLSKSMDELTDLARRVVAQFGDPEVEATHRAPRRDQQRHRDRRERGHCLVYDRPLAERAHVG